MVPSKKNSASSENRSLAGQRALVTGSSSGIGRAIALQLASAGADVVVHGNSKPEALAEIAEEIRNLGRICTVLLSDFTDDTLVDTFVPMAWDLGPIDIWINCAGADVLTGPTADCSFEEKLNRLWQVDVLATMRLSRAVGQRMIERGNGTILNIGWDQAETGMAGDSGELFAATKGAIMAFTRSLAKSLAPKVRVNAIAPGWILTAWGNTASEVWQQRAIKESLLQRWGTPQDVAHAARFLVSPEASFITGQILHINGGQQR